jgi:hypothetical protein
VALHGWIKFFAGSIERIAEQSKGSEILNILKELIFDFYDESCEAGCSGIFVLTSLRKYIPESATNQTVIYQLSIRDKK